MPAVDVEFGYIEVPAEKIDVRTIALPVTPVTTVEVNRATAKDEAQISSTGFTGIAIRPHTYFSYQLRYYLTMPGRPTYLKGIKRVSDNGDGTYTLISRYVRLRGDATIPIELGTDDPSGTYHLAVRINGSLVLEQEFGVLTQDVSGN